MTDSLTLGVHHIGLAVPDLDAAVHFFLDALEWREKGRNDEYPAVFVTDGSITVTLWRIADPANAVSFDRRQNVGLHHLALAVKDNVALMAVFQRVQNHPDVVIEFTPQATRSGSLTQHFICLMPGGIRIEFTSLSS